MNNCSSACRLDTVQTKIQQQSGRREEALDGIRIKQSELDEVKRGLDFFDNQVAAVQQGILAADCPICLDTIPEGLAVITTCGHIYCAGCIEQLITSHGSCATCRHALAAGSYRVVASAEELNGANNDADNQQILAQFGDFGSKLAHVVHCLHSIRKDDPRAKCLIYCQFDNLQNKVAEALERYGIGNISLSGNAEALAVKIKHFQNPQNLDKWVLMCSLRKKAAGMNLFCANH